MDRGRHELETVPPDDRLHVVGISPKRVERVVRADGDVGVVTDEATAKLVASVDWMGRDQLGGAGAQINHRVVESGIVDVVAKCEAVDPTLGRRRGIGTGLPGRNDISGIGRQVDTT